MLVVGYLFYIRFDFLCSDLELKKLIKIAMNLFGIQKMEKEHIKTEQVEMITTSTFTGCSGVIDHEEGGKAIAGPEREERREFDNSKFQKELRVLAWALSLKPDHPDSGFFCGGECKKCAGCFNEFNLLHYTSEKKAYCVKCYLDGFCMVIDDDTIFLVVIRTGRILIEIHDPNQ